MRGRPDPPRANEVKHVNCVLSGELYRQLSTLASVQGLGVAALGSIAIERYVAENFSPSKVAKLLMENMKA